MSQLTSFIAAAPTGHSHPQQYQGIRRGHIGVVRRSDAGDVEVQQMRRRHGRKRAETARFGVTLLIFSYFFDFSVDDGSSTGTNLADIGLAGAALWPDAWGSDSHNSLKSWALGLLSSNVATCGSIRR